MVLIFIDGPLAEEVKTWRDAPPTYQVNLPKRVTVCTCNPTQAEEEFEMHPEVFTYHRVMLGETMALYSRHTKDEQILGSLKSWVVTDLTKDWHVHCLSRRAFQ